MKNIKPLLLLASLILFANSSYSQKSSWYAKASFGASTFTKSQRSLSSTGSAFLKSFHLISDLILDLYIFNDNYSLELNFFQGLRGVFKNDLIFNSRQVFSYDSNRKNQQVSLGLSYYL